MRVRNGVTAAVVTGLAAVTVALGVGTGIAGAASGGSATPTWGPAQPYATATVGSSGFSGTIGLTFTVACPSYGHCVSGGLAAVSVTDEGAGVYVENGAGQWGQPLFAPLPSNAESGGVAEVDSIACSSTSSCVAAGSYATTSSGTQAFAVPFTLSGASASFGTPKQLALPANAITGSSASAALQGISCGAGGCAAVGSYEATGNVWTAFVATPGTSGTWSATAVTPPAGAVNDIVLNSISCPSTGACEAVGTYADSSGDIQEWAVQITGGTAATAQRVMITGAASESDSSPGDSSYPGIHPGLSGVSCPSAGVCTAVGGVDVSIGSSSTLPEGVIVPINNGVPGQNTELSQNGGAAFAELASISCSDAGDCATVGIGLIGEEEEAPITASETGGAWTAPANLPNTGSVAGVISIQYPESVACSAVGICVAAGLNIGETVSGGTVAETEGGFFAYSAFVPSITTSSLPAASVGVPYSATLQSSGGNGTASWGVSLGSLPAGLTLNAATGVISGTPTAAGQNGFAITTTNAGPPSLSATEDLAITVGPVASVTAAYSKVSGKSALIVFSCSNADCAGEYKLTGVEHLKNKKPTAVDARATKKHPPKTKTVTLASGSYSIKAGGGKAITIKLNSTGRKLLRELHKISGKLTLTPDGSTTAALIKTLKFRS